MLRVNYFCAASSDLIEFLKFFVLQRQGWGRSSHTLMYSFALGRVALRSVVLSCLFLHRVVLHCVARS